MSTWRLKMIDDIIKKVNSSPEKSIEIDFQGWEDTLLSEKGFCVCPTKIKVEFGIISKKKLEEFKSSPHEILQAIYKKRKAVSMLWDYVESDLQILNEYNLSFRIIKVRVSKS